MAKLKIECPYSSLALRLALHRLDDEKMKRILTGLDDALEEKFKTNESTLLDRVATYHGISKKDLIDSPNYQLLTEQYSHTLFTATKQYIAEQDDVSDEEAWVISMGIHAPDRIQALLNLD